MRDHALFWLIYDGGLRCNEALAINLEDIDWSERAIRIQGKGDHSCEMFCSRRVSRYLDDYLKQRGQPTVVPLFISARAAHGYNEIELKRFSGHLSLRSLEVYIAHNREAAKSKARAWERRDRASR